MPTSPTGVEIQALYERYGRAIYRRCNYFLRNEAQAEDAMHDVFVKVVESYHTFQGQASPLTWVVRITTNHCLNLLRSQRAGWRQRFESSSRVLDGARPSAFAEMERQELVRVVLDKVDKGVQQAAVYYFVDEMSQQEAADALGCSVPTLRKRLRSFVKSARKHLQSIDPDAVFGEVRV
jgi:RNA polymerase sigma-70 factor, ECF subfamily